MKKLAFAFLSMLICKNAHSQEPHSEVQDTSASIVTPQTPQVHTQKATASKPKVKALKFPNYGSLLIDWGVNRLRNSPQEMKPSFFGSRFSNISFYYNIPLGRSHFTISTGVGIGFEGYDFKKHNEKYYTLVRGDGDDRHTKFEKAAALLPKQKKILQSRLNAKYFDLGLALRFNANSKYPKESFWVAVGGKLGMLWKASTTIKYKEDGQTKKRTLSESYNLNQMRYGVQASLGWGRFGLCYTQFFSTFFDEGKGPGETTTKPYSIGLSVDLF